MRTLGAMGERDGGITNFVKNLILRKKTQNLILNRLLTKNKKILDPKNLPRFQSIHARGNSEKIKLASSLAPSYQEISTKASSNKGEWKEKQSFRDEKAIRNLGCHPFPGFAAADLSRRAELLTVVPSGEKKR